MQHFGTASSSSRRAVKPHRRFQDFPSSPTLDSGAGCLGGRSWRRRKGQRGRDSTENSRQLTSSILPLHPALSLLIHSRATMRPFITSLTFLLFIRIVAAAILVNQAELSPTSSAADQLEVAREVGSKGQLGACEIASLGRGNVSW